LRPSYVIYVMREAGRLIYVGEAKRGLFRCPEGFRVRKQPITYKWRADKDLRSATIECLLFDGFSPYGALKSPSMRQAIEADVAAGIRALTGHWPAKLSRINVHGQAGWCGETGAICESDSSKTSTLEMVEVIQMVQANGE
jgi:hypothetical protein